jgi:methyl-accepting chemotaxis protein
MGLKLSQRISLFIGLLVLAIAGGLGITSLYLSYNTTKEEAVNGLKEASQQGVNYIDACQELSTGVLEQVANRISVLTLVDQLSILSSGAGGLGYLDMAVVDKEGKAKYALSGEEVDLSDLDCVKRALKGEKCFSDIYISKATNEPEIMYAVPIELFGTIQGVLLGRSDGTILNEITDQMAYGKKGFAYIIGNDGTFFAYNDRTAVLKQVNVFKDNENKGIYKDLGSKIKKLGIGKSGIVEYQLKGSNEIISMAPIPDTNWILCLGAPQQQITKGVDNLRNLLIIFSLIFTFIGIIFSVFLGKSISKPISNIVTMLARMAQYDLTSDQNIKADKYTKRKDEIGIMAKAGFTLQENLRKLIDDIAKSAEQIATSSEELSATSQQAVISANEVASAIQDIASGASDQANDTGKGATEIELLGDLIENDLKLMENLNNSTNDVEKLKDEGFDILQLLIEKTDVTNHNAIDVMNMIQETNESTKKIEQASQMILSIASQTNLLALNAAIEAARAGEAGKGFSVVADEIRKLAEQSNGFTEKIISDIEELSDKSNHAVNVMEAVSINLKEQTDSVQVTRTKFEGIASSIELFKKAIVQLNQSGQGMGAKKDEIVGIIENLSAISEENAAGTEEAAASIEEQTASMNEIASSSESLSLLAEEMQKGIAQFKF